MYVGPGLVSMSPDCISRSPGLSPASACFSWTGCHPPSGERGQLAEKTAILGPSREGQGFGAPI